MALVYGFHFKGTIGKKYEPIKEVLEI